MKFGKLIVVSQGEYLIEPRDNSKKSTYKRRTWNCLCDCGNIKNNVLEKSLKSGLTTSCGCRKIEAAYENAKKRKVLNSYDLSGDYGIGCDLKGNEFIFDISSYDKIKDIYWMVKPDKYVEGRDNDGNYVSLHRIILDNPNCHIDHINHNPSDNRIQNLRLVTREQNQANTKIRVDNTSGVKGVHYNKTHGRWVAELQAYHKKYRRSFSTKEEAINYRKYLEETYQREYSYDNSMKGEVLNDFTSRENING